MNSDRVLGVIGSGTMGAGIAQAGAVAGYTVYTYDIRQEMVEQANAKIAERLAKAEVNIEYAYLAGGRGTEKGLIILRPSDIEKAQAALRDL